MRVLVTGVPQTGHVVPLLPLARAFAAAGDDVLVACGADVADTVAAAGLDFRPVGPPFPEWFAALAARTRGAPGDGLPPDRVESYFVPRLFGEVGTALVIDDLLAAARDHRPDLVVFDPLTFAGPLVAALVGAQPVLHSVGPLLDDAVAQLAGDAVTPIWREFDRGTPSYAGIYDGTTVTICPPALDPAADSLTRVQPMRPVPLPVAGPLPPGLPPAVRDRPMVYVTLGTFSNTNTALFSLVLDALADEPVSVVATIGRDNDPAAFAPMPPHVHVAQFIPQGDLLPHCAAVVHHAGAGTTFGALAHGLPAVALPQSADNFSIAQRLRDAGAGRVLMPDEVTQEAVRAGVRSALDDAAQREAARRLAAQIAAMPAPEDAAAALRA